jgi:Concanavalin A-like lectin/glucanases superfamily/Purple acid Phosphatase, N-terminal domain/Dockerin type I domain/Glycosyl hydrolase family 26
VHGEIYAEGNTGSSTIRKLFEIFFSSGAIQIVLQNSTTNVGNNTAVFIKNLNNSQWHHAVWVSNSSGQFIFVDGILYINDPRTTPTSITLNTANIGVMETSAGYQRYFNGTIDELMIWNRSLSAAEVAKLYNSQYPRYASPATQIFQNVGISQDGTVTSVNVSTNTTQLFGSAIQLRLWEYQGTSNTQNTTWKSIAPGTNQVSNFNILSTTNNITLEFSFLPSVYNFYSPVLRDSIIVSFSTTSDTTPPSLSGGQPSGTLAAGTTQATISLSTNEAATCRYSTSSGVAYNSMTNAFSTTGSLSHSSTISGLSNGNSYSYYVKCQDSSGNANANDYMISFSVASQSNSSYMPRNYYGARLEPVSKVLHGAGCCNWATSVQEYRQTLNNKYDPVIIQDYSSITCGPSCADNFIIQLRNWMNNFPNYTALEIGIQLGTYAYEGGPFVDLSQNVTNGQYDSNLNYLFTSLKGLNIPIYFRLGFEVNGCSWNLYSATSYQNGFIHVTNLLRSSNLNSSAATVWTIVPSCSSNYMNWYPGDQYVDWWGIDLYPVNELSMATTQNFLSDANIHGKPVMIPESSAIKLGSVSGQQRWDAWYKPFFELIHNNPGIKAFTYENTNWSKYPVTWPGWGNAQIGSDSVITILYAQEMASPLYLHASTQQSFFDSLSSTDTTAPIISSVTASSITSSSSIISWATNEASDSQVEYGLTTSYGSTTSLDSSMATSHSEAITNLQANTLYHYRVRSRDAASNLAASGDYAFTTLPASGVQYTPKIKIALDSIGSTNTNGKLQVFSGTTLIKEINFTTNSSGDYTTTLDNIPEQVNLKVIVDGFLKRAVTNINLSSTSLISFPPLLAGDLNGDNQVNSLDYSAMNTKWYQSDLVADLNKDGIVNALDYSLLNKNWQKVGE